ncbi:MAG: hypothetical protein DPW16_11150 [Chloroflexi bacterium]|nr:hypothetical protein [Chloroflexota bacterium]
MMYQQKIPVTIWLNIPSFHQTDVIKELAANDQIDLRVIFARDMPSDRLQQGWAANYDGYPYQFLYGKTPYFAAMCLAWKYRKEFHIMSGIWGDPVLLMALIMLRVLGCRYAILSETSIENGLGRVRYKSILKKVLGNLILRHKNAYVLAISELASNYYRQFGIDPNQIYTYGYFRTSSVIKKPERSPTHGTDFIYVGQLIHRKAVDILLWALIPLIVNFPDLHLRLIGNGKDLKNLEMIVEEAECKSNVEFVGTVAASEIPSLIIMADLLIMPSRHDGWGVAVNEAFSVGVPVIVSDACGAADLVNHGQNGYIFVSQNIGSLRECLQKFLAQNESERELMRQSAVETGEKICADVVALYLVQCIQHMQGQIQEKPVPPWKR